MNDSAESSLHADFSNTNPSSSSTERMDSIQQFLQDLEDLGRSVGNAVGKLAEEVTGLMVIKIGNDNREDLDVLVDAGLASTRAEAALKMIRDGIRSNESLYKKAQKTRQQIDTLRNQLRSLHFGENSR